MRQTSKVRLGLRRMLGAPSGPGALPLGRGPGLLAWVALVLVALPAPARSALILVDNTTSTRTDYWNVQAPDVPAYGSFTMTQGGRVSSASVLLARSIAKGPYNLANASVSIFDDSSDSPGTLLGSSNPGSGTLANNFVFALINLSFATPIDLNPGKYWLSLNNTDADLILWGATYASTLVNTGSNGTVNTPVLFTGPPLQADSNEAYIFKLSGSPLAAVPEPGTLVSGGIGTLLVLARLYRGRHRRPVAA